MPLMLQHTAGTVLSEGRAGMGYGHKGKAKYPSGNLAILFFTTEGEERLE